MTHAPEPGIPGDLSVFETSCAYCGARFRVLVVQAAPGSASQSYACPECGKSYRTQAAAAPHVQLLRRRSDGRIDQYQDTMF
ncbi:MAG TPA: hypothetical protein VHL79_12285 [Ramlibacter sp.]|jgi:predicted RNA-binding Zn-ribbon protein involved in translation (DUF1610 family)|nr:hypothetical protein [Ramlibacter sp.]